MDKVRSFFDSSNVSMDTLKSIFEQQPQPAPTFMEDVGNRMQLSFSKRIFAFAGFLLLGIAFLFFATFSVFSPSSFAKLYTFGNLFILGRLLYYYIKSMCGPQRAVSTGVYFASMIGTLYVALSLESVILTMILMVVQVCAAAWYGASYIPFAQDCLRGSAGAILPI